MTSEKGKNEKLKPQDSEQLPREPSKKKDPRSAVLKDEDKKYEAKEPAMKNPAKTREQAEQPVHPVKTPPSRENNE